MTLISEHSETDTRERILVVAERLFRQIGYQKTTVADIAKELRMSPANVYRFFDSKKSIHESVARRLMGEVEVEAQRIARSEGPAATRLRQMMTTINRMNTERYVGDSKLHEMVEIAMQEDWDVCVAHMELIGQTIGEVIAQGVASGEFEVEDLEDAPEEDLIAEANRAESGSDALTREKFEALESRASFDKVLFDGGEFGLGGAVGSEEEQDFLGIPGLLDAEQVSALLRQRQAEQIQRRPRAQAAEPADVVDHRRMKELRSELSKTVSAWAARSGQPHGVIHNRLREISGGPAVAQASREQLEKRLSTLRGWFVGRT